MGEDGIDEDADVAPALESLPEIDEMEEEVRTLSEQLALSCLVGRSGKLSLCLIKQSTCAYARA